MNPQGHHPNSPIPGDSISLIDILHFLKSYWKIITFFGLIGGALAVVQIATTQKQYEATAQISVSRIDAGMSRNATNNIEDPVQLISRMSYPTSFTAESLAACGFPDQTNAALALSKAIKLTIPKGLANTVEIKAFGGTPQSAQDCALAVFDLIKDSQAKIAAPYIERAKIKLSDYQERLQKLQELIVRADVRADKLGAPMSAVYLSTRDEIIYLLSEITAQENILKYNQWATSMVAPIYVSEIPIEPKKHKVLAVGLFGGLFLGLLISLALQLWLKLKIALGSLS